MKGNLQKIRRRQLKNKMKYKNKTGSNYYEESPLDDYEDDFDDDYFDDYDDRRSFGGRSMYRSHLESI